MAAPRSLLRCLLLCAAAVALVNGIVTQIEDRNFKIVSVSREVTGDFFEEQMKLTLDFTANVRPEAKWTQSVRGKGVPLTDTTLEFGVDGRGRAVARLPVDGMKMRVSVSIGYLDSHFLDMSIGYRTDDYEDNMTRTLNTELSTFSTGYDIIYSDDESFNVTVAVPKHVAPGYTWSRYHFGKKEYNVRVDACYVDQATGAVKSSVDHIDEMRTEKFLQVAKTFGEDQATVTLQFRTAEEGISGFFKIFVLSDYDDEDAPWFANDIWEVAYINVHDSSTPGPFPAGYANVRTHYDMPEYCERGERYCSIHCYGYANNIVDAKIYKESSDGRKLMDVTLIRENSHAVLFYTDLDTDADFAGNYVCEITTPELTQSKIIEVIE